MSLLEKAGKDEDGNSLALAERSTTGTKSAVSESCFHLSSTGQKTPGTERGKDRWTDDGKWHPRSAPEGKMAQSHEGAL
eukprot:1218532-Prorocentrum_lima.AAC.1